MTANLRIIISTIFFSVASSCALSVWAQGGSTQELRVIDAAGRELRLSKPARRIVGLSPHIIENLYAAGAGDHVVAAVAHSDFPQAAQALPQVGAFDTFNIERIISLKPDLVIAWGTGNGPRIVEQLSKLGIPVYVDEPQTLHDIADSIETFGKLAGEEEQGTEAAADFRRELARLGRADRTKPVSVLYQIWNEPLQTVNGEHLISDVIRLCGGENIFSAAPTPAPKINIEAVLAKNPMVIVASGTEDKPPEWLQHWQRWPSLRAVQKDLIFHIPPDILQRHTPRILGGARLMCDYLEEARKSYR